MNHKKYSKNYHSLNLLENSLPQNTKKFQLNFKIMFKIMFKIYSYFRKNIKNLT